MRILKTLIGTILLSSTSVSAQETHVVTPVKCVIEPREFFANPDDVILTPGIVREFCNTGREYRVYARYRILSSDEVVWIHYGDVRRKLDASGQTHITTYNRQARNNEVEVQLRVDNLDELINIKFELVPNR